MIKRLLVIDDDVSLQRDFKDLDCELFMELNGKDGIECYKRMCGNDKRPTLVLVDMILHGMDGTEVAQKIIEYDPGAIVFMFTAYPAMPGVDEAIASGAKGVISKDGWNFIDDVKKELERE